MRIALICHSYHEVTGSADFLVDLLRQIGTVDVYFDGSWAQRQDDWVAGFEPRAFDCIVIFQSHECFRYLNADHPNVVFVPMYDGLVWDGAFHWPEVFHSAKVLCFSSTLNREVVARHPASAYFQYYPDPKPYPQAQNSSGPRGYYWRRRPEISEQVIRRLTQGFAFEHFTVHNVPDPGSGLSVHTGGAPVDTASYSETTWVSSSATHLNDLARHNIYFAPRRLEGIGFGFLKAMAMGLCVVAPNTSTHNEYIAQGCTGVLYELDGSEAGDLRRYQEMGLRARDSMERGRRRWEGEVEKFLSFFATPSASFQRKSFAVEKWIEAAEETPAAGNPATNESLPSVTVVTVCLNARDGIERTIRSVVGQDYPGLQYVICDGASSDGTIDVIRRYENALTSWTSRPDGGVYAAMQQSLEAVKTDWVLFMNAGDFLSSADALRRLFAKAPQLAGVVYGHHIYRTTAGIDEIHKGADFGWIWSRLEAGVFDSHSIAGLPGHQATAVRTQLLRELQFDPLFRIAADHDLLCRAWKSGAQFFNADETVAVYPGGGLSEQQAERCKQEWCVIALRHGSMETAQGFAAIAGVELAGAIALLIADRNRRCNEWLTKTLPGRTLGGLMGKRALANAVRKVNNRLASATYRDVPGCGERRVWVPEEPPSPLTHSVRFSANCVLELLEAQGLADPERWGVWSDGPSVRLTIPEELPPSFRLILHACAFGPNSGAIIPVTVGSVTRQMAMKGKRRSKYQLDFSGHGGARTITFSIPHPMTPAEYSGGSSADQRRLGLGFVKMRILALSPPSEGTA
ncbi:MAG: glycosyltransferase [Candidatus Solibacter sp.]